MAWQQLHLQCEKDNVDLAEALLLEAGSTEINHQNNFGYTALIEAVALTDGSQIYLEIVQELLKYQADKTLRDHAGKTAEDYAKELGYNHILAELQK